MKKGFTLSEVMLVLSVIGVIAALTIPGIVQNTANRTLVASLKKIYSTLNQAETLLATDNDGSFTGVCSDNDSVCLRDAFLSKMPTAKKCDAGADTGNCWHATGAAKTLGGSTLSVSAPAIITNTGAFMHFMMVSSNCTTQFDGLVRPIACGRVRVDVNGFGSPNIVGRDIFDFYITEGRVIPRGTENDTAVCTPASGGWGCAGKVLSENAMNY